MSNSNMSLTSLFKKCLDILRDNEAITGDKALKELSYLLILKLIESRLDKFNLLDYDYDFDVLEQETNIDPNKLLKIISFSELAKEQKENLQQNLYYLWQCVLSEHPKTNKVYLRNENFK